MFPDYRVTYVPGLYRAQPNVRCSRRAIYRLRMLRIRFYLVRPQLSWGVRLP